MGHAGKARALLANAWVLLLAAGMLAITISAKGRLHAGEPLQDGGGAREGRGREG